MKTILSVIMLLSATTAFSASKTQNFSFQFKAKQYKSFTIVRAASTKEEAFRLAAKDCFSHLTNNKYPGEEKGLEIIDICANPKI